MPLLHFQLDAGFGKCTVYGICSGYITHHVDALQEHIGSLAKLRQIVIRGSDDRLPAKSGVTAERITLSPNQSGCRGIKICPIPFYHRHLSLSPYTNPGYRSLMAIPHFLPQAPHELWQTAASPFILPTSWSTMYKRCPTCGGNAPNVCDEVWPENWWEDDMMGLMYQGHIPPSERVSPWEQYYAEARKMYIAAMAAYAQPQTPPQSPLRIDTKYGRRSEEMQAPYQPPMTPPMTPGVQRTMPHYTAPLPASPVTPSLPYPRQATWENRSATPETPQTAPAPPPVYGTLLFCKRTNR